MALSLPQRLKEWLKSKQWKQDAVHGWNAVQSAGSSIADRSFKEGESLRLRYRLARVNERLFQAYRTFGKKVLDHWSLVYVLTEDERKREFRRIRLLLEEQKNLLDQTHELHDPALSVNQTPSQEKKKE